jgi:hypothetical protein
MVVGQQRIISWMEAPRNAEHLDFAFPFADSFAMIRNANLQSRSGRLGAHSTARPAEKAKCI